MYTTQNAIARVYTLLRKPTQEELYYEDVRDALNALIKGYVQDMDMGNRDQRAVVEEVQVAADDIDFTVTVANVPDYEPEKLEIGTLNGNWFPINLVSLQAFDPACDYLAGSFYGSSALPKGQKLRLNLSSEIVSQARFRLTYRLPLLMQVQMGERPPIPENFMPMLEYDGALDCMDIVKNDSDDWIRWCQRTTPKYLRRSEAEHERWQAYLDTSVEDPVQNIKPFDSFRRGGSRSTKPRAFLPLE